MNRSHIVRASDLIVVVLAAAAATACSARPAQPTTPVRYACESTDLVRTGDALVVSSRDGRSRWSVAPSSRDDLANHYTVAGVELVVPHDPHADAIARAASKRTGVCTARRGYTEALSLFASGSSIREVAAELALDDPSAARELVHHAMLDISRRYYGDR